MSFQFRIVAGAIHDYPSTSKKQEFLKHDFKIHQTSYFTAFDLIEAAIKTGNSR